MIIKRLVIKIIGLWATEGGGRELFTCVEYFERLSLTMFIVSMRP